MKTLYCVMTGTMMCFSFSHKTFLVRCIKFIHLLSNNKKKMKRTLLTYIFILNSFVLSQDTFSIECRWLG